MLIPRKAVASVLDAMTGEAVAVARAERHPGGWPVMIDIALAVPIGVEERLREDLEHTVIGSSARRPAPTSSRWRSRIGRATSRWSGQAPGTSPPDFWRTPTTRVCAWSRSSTGTSSGASAGSLGLHEVVSSTAMGRDRAGDRGSGEAAGATTLPRRARLSRCGVRRALQGRTSVAVSVAAEIAAAGHTVALADVDTFSASVAPTLGLLDESPGFAAACRLAGAGSLSRLELERVGQRYLSGHGSFWVLTGIGRASRWPELTAERVTGTIRECRSWVDFTVLDTGSSLEERRGDLQRPLRPAQECGHDRGSPRS